MFIIFFLDKHFFGLAVRHLCEIYATWPSNDYITNIRPHQLFRIAFSDVDRTVEITELLECILQNREQLFQDTVAMAILHLNETTSTAKISSKVRS